MTTRHYKVWTTEEDELLLELAGVKSLLHIADTLKRKPSAIKERLKTLGVSKQGLRDFKGVYTAKEFAEFIGYSPSGVMHWIKARGLPASQKDFLAIEKRHNLKKRPYSIDIEKFWNWAKVNQDVLDFRKIPDIALSTAPRWVWKLREKKKKETPINFKKLWTKGEEEYLLWAIRGKNANIAKLAIHFQREEKAVVKKLKELRRTHQLNIHIHDGNILTDKPLTPVEKAMAKHNLSKKELLIKWHWKEKLSLNEIASRLGYQNNGFITEWFKKLDIPYRNKLTDTYFVTIGKVKHKVLGERNKLPYLRIPSHPYADKEGYVAKNRVIMEKHLGRYLRPTESVRNINQRTADNRIENLQLVESHSSEQTA